jgi:uncharacterized membrane protein
MTYLVLRFIHLLGLTLIGAGLIGVWITDLRSRQVGDLALFAEAVRTMAVLYDGLVVPGAVVLLGSGLWMTAIAPGFEAALDVPWLVGMMALFAFEFVEGNTVTRRYIRRLLRLSGAALARGAMSPELAAVLTAVVPRRYPEALGLSGPGGPVGSRDERDPGGRRHESAPRR